MAMSRVGFGEALLEAGRKNKKVMALCADLTDSIKISAFAEAFPDRFVQTGVAEQNMMGIAAGLALSGKIPFVASYAVFNPGRNWDQLRVSVAYSEANVKIIGAHAGISVGPDGATHQALEDVAITRVIPNLVVIVPTDIVETRKVVEAAIAHHGPVYIRFGRDKVPTVTVPETPFTIGKANLLRSGTDVTVCANGPLVYEALQAAAALARKKISVEVLAVPTVKPLDEETIIASVKKTGALVTAEEAQINGGLGGALAELIGEKYPVPLRRVGVRDIFGESGTPAELMDAYGLRAKDIGEAAMAVIKRKSKKG
ncbi:transketolase family protein [Patescibacteria group bacterium]|nr:transketolase family protein [Patescibacteria group bacterium]